MPMKQINRGKRLEQEIAFFSEYVSEHKKNLFQTILGSRTRYVTVVLEDIYQSQNASAVLRSCDGFGIQDVHVIENRNAFDVDKGVTIGADKWLTVHRYKKSSVNNTEVAYKSLREKGYRIVATTPHQSQVTLPDYRPEQPSALIFGAEKAGLSDYAIKNADEWLHLPMYGFSESYNISVCVALCLYHLRRIMEDHEIPWQIEVEERQHIYLEWLRQSVKRLGALDRKFEEIYRQTLDRI